MMRLMFAVLLLSCASPAWAGPSPLAVNDAGVLLKDIEASGPRAVMSRMDWDSWDAIMEHVETGDAEWLAVVKELSCCADAGYGEMLPIAVSIALTRAPEATLRVAGRPESYLELEEICTVPFFEPFSRKEFDDHVTALKKAMAQVKDPALQAKKAECSKEIAETHWVGEDA